MDKVSVVMATYNGENRILKQLESLRKQTKAPDEVLIFDDLSTDGTAEMIRSYIGQNGLSGWKLEINSAQKGWKRNFAEGIRKASGEFIFPCDQDDVWDENKIQQMTEAAEADEHILLLACDYRVVYEPGAVRAKIYQKTVREATGLVSRYEFKQNFFMNPCPGCSYLVRKSFADQVLEQWFSAAPHDEFLWLMATVRDGAYFYNRSLMDYYRYAESASNIRYKDIPMQKENIAYIGEMLRRLLPEAMPEKIPRIEEAIIWRKKREQLMNTRNPLRWLGMMPYWGYYNSPKNCLSDLWLVLFGKFKR